MDSLVFSEFCEHYCDLLRREEKKRLGLDDILPMLPLQQQQQQHQQQQQQKQQQQQQRQQRPPDEDDFLTLANEGKYTKSREADV
jgi:hypothetical protein